MSTFVYISNAEDGEIATCLRGKPPVPTASVRANAPATNGHVAS